MVEECRNIRVRLSLLSLLRGRDIFCRPDGTKIFRGYEIPAMNCRAIFKCPYGTGTVRSPELSRFRIERGKCFG